MKSWDNWFGLVVSILSYRLVLGVDKIKVDVYTVVRGLGEGGCIGQGLIQSWEMVDQNFVESEWLNLE